LHSRHLPIDFGNQRGINPSQICTKDEKLLVKLLLNQHYKLSSNVIDIPLILGEETFPTGDIFVEKEANSSNVSNAFASFSQEQKSEHKATEIEEIIGSKCRSEQPDVRYDSFRKEGIHRFSFVVIIFTENLFSLFPIYFSTTKFSMIVKSAKV
jgi:hypothetical protein